MDAKELMIGDYVSVTAKFFYIAEDGKNEKLKWKIERRICKVEELNKDSIKVDAAAYEYISIEPVPLTEEMLKINGLRRKSICNDYDEWFIEMTPNYPWWHFNIIHYMEGELNYKISRFSIRYVHEFQHILKDCGMSDLADNFEIE